MSENEVATRFRVGMRDWTFRLAVILFVLCLASLVGGWLIDSLPVIFASALVAGLLGHSIARAIHLMGRQQRESGRRHSWDEDPTCLCTAAERAAKRCSVPCPPEWIR